MFTARLGRSLPDNLPNLIVNDQVSRNQWCGSDTASEARAFAVAESNLRSKYTLVALLEHFDISLALLAHLVPGFFAGADGNGAAPWIQRLNKSFRNKNSQAAYTEISPRAAQKLLSARENSFELLLYQLVVARFWELADRHGLSSPVH